MLKFLNIERAVIVTPPGYGNDNSVTLAAIEKLGRDRARGVALVDETTSSERRDSMMKGGITGIRLFLGGAGVFRPAAAAKHLQTAIDLANVRGWHLDISAPPDGVSALAPQLAACPVPLGLDYFGWVAGGVKQPGFEAVLSVVQDGRHPVKLAEPYAHSNETPQHGNLVSLLLARTNENPDS